MRGGCSVLRMSLVVHFVGEGEREDVAFGVEVVEESDEVGRAVAAHHEVDDGGVVSVVVAQVFVGDVYAEGAEAVAVGVGIGEYLADLQADNLHFAATEEVLFAQFKCEQHEDDGGTGYDGDEVESCPHGESDTGGDPNASCRSESTHRAFHLDDGSGSKKAYTRNDLGGYALRVAVLGHTEIVLRDVEGENHGQGCAHRDEGEGAHSGYLAFVTTLQANSSAEGEAEQQLEDGTNGVDAGGVDLFEDVVKHNRGNLKVTIQRLCPHLISDAN